MSHEHCGAGFGADVDALCERASSKSVGVTPARRKVMEAMSGLAGPFTASELEAEVARRAPGVGRATIFRTVKLLRQAGILGHIRMGDGQDGYVLCISAHHHHLICKACGAIDELAGCAIGPVLEALLADKGFVHESHVVDIYGTCAKCGRRDK